MVFLDGLVHLSLGEYRTESNAPALGSWPYILEATGVGDHANLDAWRTSHWRPFIAWSSK